MTINAYRNEIQYHDLNTSYKSEEETKWFFDNMTEYLDSLLDIQEEVAARITEEVRQCLMHLQSVDNFIRRNVGRRHILVKLFWKQIKSKGYPGNKEYTKELEAQSRFPLRKHAYSNI